MRAAFSRCTELLDIEESKEDEIEKHKREIREKVEGLTSEMLSEVLALINNSKTVESRELLPQMKQSSSSEKVGNSQELYQTEKSSSKDRSRSPR